MRIKLFPLASALLVSAMATCGHASTRQLVTAPLRSALAGAKGVTDIPILLPSSLPDLIERDVAQVSFVKGDAGSYDITLYQSDPAGEATILVGDFSGNAHYKGVPIGKSVRLANHIIGHFLPRSCGGSCAPSSIEWSVKGVYYEIQLRFGFDTKRAEQKTMINVANSAIEAGAR